MIKSHHTMSPARFPPAVVSSAKQTCLVSLSSRWWMSGVIMMAYIATASGSPWVVPSCKSLSINKQLDVLFVGVHEDFGE